MPHPDHKSASYAHAPRSPAARVPTAPGARHQDHAHNHLAEPFGGGWDQRPAAELLDLLDAADVRVFVDLDGGWGEDLLHRHLDHFKAAAPERFAIFGGVNWAASPDHGDRFGEWTAERLRAQVRRGAQGLKIWKPFGLQVRDHRGALVAVDDAR